MLYRLKHHLCSMLPGNGEHGGRPTGVRDVRACAPGRRAETGASGVGNNVTAMIIWAVLALLLHLAPATALASMQGDRIDGEATFSSNGQILARAMVSVTVVIRSTASIEFLKYAPLNNGSLIDGAAYYNVGQSWYRTGHGESDAMAPEAAPTMLGSATPLDLSQPMPLVKADSYHAGEPIFVQVTDPDQNLDRTSRDTILTTVTNSTTGETEVLRLTETGPDTGVFVGYLNSTEAADAAAPLSYNGGMAFKSGNGISAVYHDSSDNSDSVTAAVIVDPYGILFDSQTGAPIDGATVTLWDVRKNAAATVYGDDGVSPFPSKVTTGSVFTVPDSKGRQVSYSFPPGGFRFPFIVPGTYQLRVTVPSGHIVPSAGTDFSRVPGGPFAISDGSFGKEFNVNPGPSIRIDIPADPVAGRLWIQKSAGKSQAAIGDFVGYDISVQNNDAAAATAIIISDRLPQGFRYRTGSTRINQLKAADPTVSADGRSLVFSIGELASKASATIDYVTEVSAGAALGVATNVASATSGSIASNLASAQVDVRSDFLSTRSLIMGRVSNGACSDDPSAGSQGIPGVRIFLEDGTFVDTDKKGMYHFEGVTPRAHVVQLDLDSLPEGYEAVPCEKNSRFAGRAYSQFVELQGGSLWRADFHLARSRSRGAAGEHQAKPPVVVEPPKEVQVEAPPEPEPEVAAAPAPAASVGIDLKSALRGEKGIEYQVRVWGGAEKVSAKKLTITLPQGLAYFPQSSELDGRHQEDPVQQGANITYTLPDSSDEWIGILRFNAAFAAAGREGDLLTKAVLSFDTPTATKLTTPVAENVLSRVRSEKRLAMPDIVLHPHFPSFGTDLNAEDRAKLDDVARMLMVLAIDRITVSGHTDNVRIAPHGRRVYADNKALSYARARSVGRYLIGKLHLPPEKIQYSGLGESQPIASNGNAAGRALNRRVELRVQAARLVEKDVVELKKDQSGLQQMELAAAPLPVLKEMKRAVKAQPVQKVVAALPAVKQEAVTQGRDAAPPAQQKPAGTTQLAELANPEIVLDAEAAAAVEPSVQEPEGVLSPAKGSVLIFPINGVRICLNGTLTPRLTIDGAEVPAERIGFTMKDTKSGKTIYSYVGVDFGAAGEHTVTLQGLDPFGNARFNQSVKIVRSGVLAGIRVKSAAGNIADGKTPVKLQLELIDASGSPIAAAADLEIREGDLRPLKKEEKTQEQKSGQYEMVHVDAQGNVLFQPVTRSGLYRLTLASNGVKLETETYLKPALRDWILVGIGEGTVGYNALSGHLEGLKEAGVDDKLYENDRLAFYAKGTVKGEWLLTAAYDSAKSTSVTGNGLFQTIDPNTYYTLYGDAGNQQYDAASTKKLYLKIERDQFYALFGDYDTGLSVTELSRYSRRMSGVKAEFHDKNLDLVAFGSQSGQSYVKDEIQGDGTSGLYHLSHRGILLNSDRITIQVRARTRSELLVSTRSLSRFTDYSIDYDSGTLLFKEPIYSRDDQDNPIFIVAEYETQNSSSGAITAGGRAGVKLFDNRLKAGISYIHEGQESGRGDSIGVDTSIKLAEGSVLRAEAAHTDTNFGTSTKGDAYLAELTEKLGKFESRLYYREIGTGFGLGQQQGSEVGTRKFGADGLYRLSEFLTVNGQANKEYVLSTGAERSVGEARAIFSRQNYGASLGVRYAEDLLGDGTRHSSDQVSMGANWLTLNKKLTLKVTRDQSIGSGDNADYPTRTVLGADYKLSEQATLFAAQEFTEGSSNKTNSTRAGIKTNPWQGGALSSSVERSLDENQDRMFALFGLKQTFKLTDRWSLDFGVDRSQTVRNRYLLNVNTPPASGANEDFTAVSIGSGYKQSNWGWDGRVEARTATSENKYGVITSLLGEPMEGWGWSARLQLFKTDGNTDDSLHGDLRLGLVYRPQRSRWILLDRLDFLVDQVDSATSSTPLVSSSSNSDDRRIVNNMTANYKPSRNTQLSLQYGAKYVLETIDGASYSGYTDLIGVEGRYDFTEKWDLGLRGSLLHSWGIGQEQGSAGVSIGYNVVENAWISLGYNFIGFNDKDFSAANYTAQGPYLRFRFKFDQNSVKDAVKWINQ
jgi:uncharacterized repeat protein (TIGR01451 family)